jgi:hypothetical protein
MHHIEPVESIGDEEIGYFMAAEVKDIGMPVGMKALAHVLVFVESGTIETA